MAMETCLLKELAMTGSHQGAGGSRSTCSTHVASQDCLSSGSSLVTTDRRFIGIAVLDRKRSIYSWALDNFPTCRELTLFQMKSQLEHIRFSSIPLFLEACFKYMLELLCWATLHKLAERQRTFYRCLSASRPWRTVSNEKQQYFTASLLTS